MAQTQNVSAHCLSHKPSTSNNSNNRALLNQNSQMLVPPQLYMRVKEVSATDFIIMKNIAPKIKSNLNNVGLISQQNKQTENDFPDQSLACRQILRYVFANVY